ncbi:cytochrome P450, partial [Gloeopeniophorella convolvens]
MRCEFRALMSSQLHQNDDSMVSRMRWEWFFPSARYAEPWRIGRRMLDRSLRPTSIVNYRPMLEARTHVFLSRLLAQPEQFQLVAQRLQGELIMSLVYAYEVKGEDDPMLLKAKEMTEIGSASTLPGALLVNVLPFLKHIPAWLPWVSYKPFARRGYEVGRDVVRVTFRWIKDRMEDGTAQPSLTLECLREAEQLPAGHDRDIQETFIANTMGSMFSCTSASFLSTLESLFLMLSLYPEVQARERLPNFDDQPRLPYINAICIELLRWRLVLPSGFPHATTEDDTYNGYFIPKGSIIIPNAWAILHDPERYPDPETFKPERYLNTDGAFVDDPVVAVAFGFGKRICPGRHFVNATVFIVVSSL